MTVDKITSAFSLDSTRPSVEATIKSSSTARSTSRTASRTSVVVSMRNTEREAAWARPHETTPNRAAQLRRIFYEMSSIEGTAQRHRLLAAMQDGPVTTLEARRYLDVQCVSARVAELKADGHPIEVRMVVQASELGRTRLVAQYDLLRDSV